MNPVLPGRMAVNCLLGAALGVVVWCAPVAQAADDFIVTARANGSAVTIDARATLSAPHAVIWAALTDYNRLADFIPGMRSSRVTGRRGTTSIVEQQGKAEFLIFSSGVEVVVASTEYPPDVIEISALKGNLKQLDGRYRIERGAKAGTWVLRWVGLIEPAFILPAFIGVPLIRGNIEDQFRGMVEEIERRDATRRLMMATQGVQ